MSGKLTPGTRLRSQVCQAEVVVVRGGTGVVELTCGGALMVPLGTEPATGVSPVPQLMTSAAVGKRYTASRDEAFEVLVTRPGAGTLADGTNPLVVKVVRPLPASD